jgi:hypothetical protein
VLGMLTHVLASWHAVSIADVAVALLVSCPVLTYMRNCVSSFFVTGAAWLLLGAAAGLSC